MEYLSINHLLSGLDTARNITFHATRRVAAKPPEERLMLGNRLVGFFDAHQWSVRAARNGNAAT
jgi:hypothetical protein